MSCICRACARHMSVGCDTCAGLIRKRKRIRIRNWIRKREGEDYGPGGAGTHTRDERMNFFGLF